MGFNEIIDAKYLHRQKLRLLLIIYDIFFMGIAFFSIYLMNPSSTAGIDWMTPIGYITHGATALVCCLVPRLLFDVYHEILRYGNMGAISRILAADFVGGIAYYVIDVLLLPETVSFLRTFALIIFNFVLSISARLVYVYLFSFACGESKLAHFVAGFLRIFARIDVYSKDPGNVIATFGKAVQTVPIQPINDIQRIARQFEIQGRITNITQINRGYVNRTYHVETLSDAGHVHHYTLQRINTNAFPDVDALMANYALVTSHLQGKLHLPGEGTKGSVSMVRSSKNGGFYLKDDSGSWRMMTHFTGVYSLNAPDSPETFYYAGRAFGEFEKCMADVPCEAITEVIPNFHNTPSRYNDLLKAIQEDPMRRVAKVSDEIQFLLQRKDSFGIISKALDEGKIPYRICHNDCNLNNILFDKQTHLPAAIIDLDTVMPSTPLYDFGDSMRAGTNTATDDEKDLSKVHCDLNLYEKYARGYLEACGKSLTKTELELLPYSSLVITSEDSIRFLMDHINGDVYYNIYYHGQNLDRARTQMALVADMERKLPEICEVLRKIYAELGLKADLSHVNAWRVID